jgi:hypothetical protein
VDPNSEISKAEQRIAGKHHRASSGVNEGAVCNAIAAIFVAFKWAMPAVTTIGPGLRR